MKTNVQETSVAIYKRLIAEGEVSRQQAAILCRMVPGEDYTRAELSELSKLPINAICGRVFELVNESHLLEDGENRACTITGNTAKTVRLVDVLAKAA